MRSSTARPPSVHVPTISPLIGKAVFSVHQDPMTEARPVRSASTALRTRSPVPIPQRKPWGANATTPRKNIVPTSPSAARRVDRQPSVEARRASLNQSPAQSPVLEMQWDDVHGGTAHETSSNLAAVLKRLEAVERENALLRSLVLELTGQMNELRQGVQLTKDVQDTRVAELAARTNYVVGWVDHFNGLVTKVERNSPTDVDDGPQEVARALNLSY